MIPVKMVVYGLNTSSSGRAAEYYRIALEEYASQILGCPLMFIIAEDRVDI
jgi:hypothetical protein